jgi:hypothetical protein
VLGYLVSYFSSFQPRHLTFASALDRTNPRYPIFDVNPKMTVTLSRFDPETNRYNDIATLENKRPAESKERLDYSLQNPVLETGSYRYQYVVSGTTSEGPFVMSSPWFPLVVRTGWEWYGIPLLALLVLVVLSIRNSGRCRLEGIVEKRFPAPVTVKELSEKQEEVTFAGLTFTLTAVCIAFFYKRVRFQIAQGMNAELGEKTVEPGERTEFKPGEITLSFQTARGQQNLTIKVDVIC